MLSDSGLNSITSTSISSNLVTDVSVSSLEIKRRIEFTVDIFLLKTAPSPISWTMGMYSVVLKWMIVCFTPRWCASIPERRFISSFSVIAIKLSTS